MVETADVVVLGSGGGALSAALTASAGGAEVIVLEVAPVFGGTTAISGGGMWLPCNPHDPNWSDSPAEAKTYLKRLTLGFVSDAVLDRFIDVASTVTTFFSQHTPLTFAADVGRPDYQAPLEGSSLTSRTVFPGPYELPRLGEYAARVRMPPGGGIRPIQHWEERPHGDVAASDAEREAIEKLVADRIAKGIVLRGRALIGGLMEGSLANNARFFSDTRARSLIMDGGRVVGVRAEQDGREVEYRARFGVVIATGGFEWNRELWDNFMAVPYDGPKSPPYNRGDGLIMAAEVGAKLGCLDKAIWSPGSHLGEVYDGQPRTASRQNGQVPGEILVNRQGRRFVNECVPYNDIGRAYMQFDPQSYDFVNYPFYAIGDKHGLAGLEARYEQTDGDGWVVGETIHEVGEKLGIDADALVEQVKEWNANCEKTGTDPVFHRGERPWEVHMLPNHQTLGPILDGPFFGHRGRGGIFGTRGGPVVNEDAQILNYRDQPIAGLYGAGNAIAAPLAHTYPGGGGTVGPAVVFGHIAGKSILKDNGRPVPE